MTNRTGGADALPSMLDVAYYQELTGERFGSASEAALHYRAEGFGRRLPFNPLIDIDRAAPALNLLWQAGDLDGFVARLADPDLCERTGWLFDPTQIAAPTLDNAYRSCRRSNEGWLPFFMRTATADAAVPVSVKFPLDAPSWASVRRAAIAVSAAWRRMAEGSGAQAAETTQSSVGVVLTCKGAVADVLAAARRLGGLGSHQPTVLIVVADGSAHTATALAAATAEQSHIFVCPQARPTRAVEALTCGVRMLRTPVVMHVGRAVRLDGASALRVAEGLLETTAAVAQPLLVDGTGLVWHGGTAFAAGKPLPFLAGHPPEDALRHGGQGFRSVSSSVFAVRRADYLNCVGTPGYIAEALRQIERRLRVRDDARGLVVVDSRATVDTGRSNQPTSHATGGRVDDVVEHYERAGFACDVDGKVVSRVLVADRGSDKRTHGSNFIPAGVFPRLRWAIKCASPAGAEGETWGDTFFAEELAAAFRRLGQDVVVDRRQAHGRATSAFDDVVVWLRGLAPMHRQAGACNILWVISHPDTVTDSELLSSDMVFAASREWAESAQKRVGRSVSPLLQACDPSLFYPLLPVPDEPGPALFVGSPRARGGRPVVSAALEAGIALEVCGPRWGSLLPPEVHKATSIDRASVNEAYQRSLFVLCDHWPDMAREGFISNRVFDAVASGARVVSDEVDAIRHVFGRSVVTFRTPEHLAQVASAPEAYFLSPEQRRASALAVARDHSFDSRARELLTSVLDNGASGPRASAMQGNETRDLMGKNSLPPGVFESDRLVRRYAASQAGVALEEYETAIERLAYRRGFLLVPVRSDAVSIARRQDWLSSHIGGYWLMLHPDVRSVTSEGATGTVVLLGDAFDPWAPTMSLSAIADVIRRELEAKGDIYPLLDRLAGRFRILWLQGEEATVWHDAMGSAAVFYDEDGGGCASHAGLLAEFLRRRQRDYVVPFLTSEGYRRRDVKYFPGVLAPFEGIVQLSPNTELDVSGGIVRRYWPRNELRRVQPARARDVLTEYLLGQAAWMREMHRVPLLGVTSGTDSRGLLAASADDRPGLFTYVRSATGSDRANADSRAAEELAARVGLNVSILRVQDITPLSGSGRPIDVAYRLASGGIRGANATWVARLAQQLELGSSDLMVRGFGGEVLRGFYQSMPTAMRRLSPNQLARTYDVNAGSGITRAAFAHMLEVTQMSRTVEAGMDPNDVIYWEHRMGTWGSISMLESDLAANGMPGYNSRSLFETFLGIHDRNGFARGLMHDAIMRIRPVLMM